MIPNPMMIRPVTVEKHYVLVKNFTYTQGSTECVWKQVFEDDEREEMSRGLFYVVILSIVCSLWMWGRTNTAIYQRLHNKKSYLVLRYFFLGTLLKNLVGLASYSNDADKFNTLPTDRFLESCKFYGALYTFFNIFELEALTHSCIERYVNAKYIANGWDLSSFGYWMYWALSLFFAVVYTCLPFMGFGSYGYDYNCLSCTLSMVELDNFQSVLYLVKTIKPVSIMYVAKLAIGLLAAEYVTSQSTHEGQVKRDLQSDAFFNFVVKKILVVNLLFWGPTYYLRCCTVVSQYVFKSYIQTPPHKIISWVWFIAELAPVATALVLFIEEQKARIVLRKVHNK